MNKMREEFEVWFEYAYGWSVDEYPGLKSDIETSWATWKASREAIVIELPPLTDRDSDFYDGFDAARNYGIKECSVAIKNHGLKVRED
jgi:hypothetical protein